MVREGDATIHRFTALVTDPRIGQVPTNKDEDNCFFDTVSFEVNHGLDSEKFGTGQTIPAWWLTQHNPSTEISRQPL